MSPRIVPLPISLRALINNMVQGVTTGFSKKINGIVGFRVAPAGDTPP